MTIDLKTKPGLTLAGHPGTDEMTENPHPLNAYYTLPPEKINNQIFSQRYLDELKRLSDQASRMGMPLLALELAILRAERFAAMLRDLERMP